MADRRSGQEYGPVMAWTIRAALPSDRDGILEVVRAAFSGADRDPGEELEIVERTWSCGARPPGLELVATDRGMVIGHVLAAEGDLGGRPTLAIAPLSVMPHAQGQGIGTALMTELLHRTDDVGCPLVVVLGDHRYYRRFGFEAAGPLGIVYEPVGRGSPHFQARRLDPAAPTHGGRFVYCWEERRD